MVVRILFKSQLISSVVTPTATNPSVLCKTFKQFFSHTYNNCTPFCSMILPTHFFINSRGLKRFLAHKLTGICDRLHWSAIPFTYFLVLSWVEKSSTRNTLETLLVPMLSIGYFTVSCNRGKKKQQKL